MGEGLTRTYPELGELQAFDGYLGEGRRVFFRNVAAGRLSMLPKDSSISRNIGIACPGLSELLQRKKKDIRLGGGYGEEPGRSWKRVGEWI